MAKTQQVLKMISKGRIITVIRHHDDDYNPFWIYVKYDKRKTLMAKYADMTSCLYWIYEAIKPIG